MEEVSLPTKTKFITRWLKRLGIFLLIYSISLLTILVIFNFLYCFPRGAMGCPTPKIIGWISLPIAVFLPLPIPDLDMLVYDGYFSLHWEDYYEVIGLGLVYGALLIIFTKFLSKMTKKWWVISIILFSIFFASPILFAIFIGIMVLLSGGHMEINSITSFFWLFNWFLGFIFYDISLVFLFLDRKNFWKITS